MQRYLYFLFGLLFFLPLQSESAEPHFLVSVSPYRTFVKKIAGEDVSVEVLVPAGASAHTFEPSPKQMIKAGQASIWFRIGEPFEAKALQALQHANPNLIVVDLWEGISLLHSECKEHRHCGADLHLWLSPANGMIQAKLIAAKLSSTYPEKREIFQKNLESFLNELQDLDAFIRHKTATVKNRTLVVSHPAYGYFCKDYNFTQLSIEFEGRDPTSKQLTTLLQQVKQVSPKAIFTQPQYSDKAAALISKQVNAALIPLDPYAEQYISAMRHIAEMIAEYNRD